MKLRTLHIFCICAVLLFVLVLPASAEDTSQVNVTPSGTVTLAVQPAFDPIGSFMSILGLRHDDQNLTQDIHANDQEIHQNWWDNLNIFQVILGNRAAVRSDQESDLANRSEDIGYREDIHTDRQDLRNDSGNQSAYEQQIAGYRTDIEQNRQDINATHQDIKDERDANQLDWANINTTQQQDLSLRQENVANREQIQDNRQQIRTDRNDAGSS